MYVISQPYVMHLLLQQDFLKYIIDDKTQNFASPFAYIFLL